MTFSAADLVGTWELCRYDVTFGDSTVVSPYGPAPSGLLIYGADGFMSVSMADPARPPLGADTTRATGAAAQIAVATHISYGGTYRVQDDSVIHKATISSMQEMVGLELARRVELAGEDLSLIADEITFDGKPAHATLKWRRAMARQEDQ